MRIKIIIIIIIRFELLQNNKLVLHKEKFS